MEMDCQDIDKALRVGTTGITTTVYNRHMEFTCLFGVKVIYLINRTDLFRAGGLVFGGNSIVTDLHSSLRNRESGKIRQELRQRKRGVDGER
jgi:hypothetical protein